MLPPDFKWLRKEVDMVYGDTRWLYVGSRVVAMVGRTIDGQWYTTVNRHQEVQQWRDANCARLEQGMRWVERWALAHADRLRATDTVSEKRPVPP